MFALGIKFGSNANGGRLHFLLFRAAIQNKADMKPDIQVILDVVAFGTNTKLLESTSRAENAWDA